MKILSSKIKCKHCESIIESTYRHDFQQCNCGKIFIDGGLDYQRFGFPPEGEPNSHYENLSVYEEEIIEETLDEIFEEWTKES
jgi:hypothetical protein